MDYELIEQAELSEDCPCGTGLQFGHCCGSAFLCDCESGEAAEECCYSEISLPKDSEDQKTGT